MLTNINKTSISFNYFYNERVLSYKTQNRQQRESEQIMNLLSSEEATNSKARIIALACALKIELADGNQENRPAVRKQLPMVPYHHPWNRQYKLYSVFRCYRSNFSKMLLN